MMRSALAVSGNDLSAAALALERLGLRLLQDLLDRGPGVPAREWLTRSEARLFARMSVRQVGWRRAVARMKPSASLPQTTTWPPADRVHIARHSIAAWTIPHRLLWLLGRRAWGSPRFHSAVARRLHAHLRKSLLLPLIDLPPVRADMGVMWLLVAAAPLEMSLPMRVGLTHRRRRLAILRLRTFAQAAAAATPPIGFWNEWLTWLVRRRGGMPRPDTWTSSFGAPAPVLADAAAAMTEDAGVVAFSDSAKAAAVAALYDAWCLSPEGVSRCSRSTRSSGLRISISRRWRIWLPFKRSSRASSTASRT